MDLHVHTPASIDTHPEWRDIKPQTVVESALKAELDAIGITDHNSVEWCEEVREAAANTPLTVFPGTELSTPEGHLLCIFDPDKDVQELRDLLVKVGIGTDHFGDLEAVTDTTIEKTADHVTEYGGVAIAAHVDRPKGFWSLTSETAARRKAIYGSSHIQAMELVDLEIRSAFLDGTLEGYPRKLACIQGSDCYAERGDAHRIDMVGRRFTWVKVGSSTARALSHAFADPTIRIRLRVDETPQAGWVIEALAATGGFLDGQTLKFNQDVTSLIGGTGVGKSLSIELLRFVLDQQVDEQLQLIANEVTKRLEGTLADGSVVRALLRRGETRYLVERTWEGGQGADPIVYRVSDNDSLESADKIHVPTFFPITAFSQGEVIEFARQLPVRLRLVDELIDIEEERGEISDLEAAIRENATSLLQTRIRIERGQARIEPLPGLGEQIARLESFFEEGTLEVQKKWQLERSFISTAETRLGEAQSEIRSALASAPESLLEEAPDLGSENPNPGTIELLQEIDKEYRQALDEHGNRLNDALAELQTRASKLAVDWNEKFGNWQREYEQELAALGESGVGLGSLYQKLERLRSERAELLREKSRLDSYQSNEAELERERQRLVERLLEVRTLIRDKRRQKATDLSDRLDGRVRIRIRRFGMTDAINIKLLDLRRGSRIQEPDIQEMARNLHPALFVPSLINQDYDTLSRHSGLDPSLFERLSDAIKENDRLDDLYEFQLLNPEDTVEIQFAVEDNQYRELEALAHGQKCTVVLMIAMAEGDWPLIADQPEDALHAPWIEENIVSRLRDDRGSRQFVFATKSPSILVSADAEQVIALESDANRGWIDKTGSIDDFDSRDMIVYHVEGGKEPLARRQAKYDLGIYH